MPIVADTLPIVAAPMAGGPSTPRLVAAVSGAGAFGFLAGGHLTPEALDRDLAAVEHLTDRPYGVNLFLPSAAPADPAAVARYAAALAGDAAAAGVAPGVPRYDDDALGEKLQMLTRYRPAVVSVTFGLPSPELCEAVRRAGSLVAATVTTDAEARAATDRGVDLLVAQGAEAGGHRGVFHDDGVFPGGGELVGRTELVERVRSVSPLPVVAAGGIATGADIRGALAAGAVACQLGTAFLCCPEAGTSPTHRRALLERRYADTIVTRAFTGRPARALRNGFADRFDALAPAAYPEVHHLTRPLRAAAGARGDADALHLWAGTAWRRVTTEPATDLVARLERERRG